MAGCPTFDPVSVCFCTTAVLNVSADWFPTAASGMQALFNMYNTELPVESAIRHVRLRPLPLSIGKWQPKTGLSEPV